MTTVILLSWTAMDLSVTSICTLDQAGVVQAGASAARVAPELRAPIHGDASQTPSQTDDCFCCSHMVDVEGAPGLLAPVETVDILTAHSVTGHRNAARALYHPPQASL